MARKKTWMRAAGPASGWEGFYYNAGGRRRTRIFRLKRDAQIWEALGRAGVAPEGLVVDPRRATVETAARAWIEAGEAEDLERSTIKERRVHVEHHILPLLGARRLADLTPPDIEAYAEELLRTRSRTMAARALYSLRRLLERARRLGWIGQNPASSTRIRGARRVREPVAMPSLAELRALLEAAIAGAEAEARNRPKDTEARFTLAWLCVHLFGGLRASEVRGLKWEDLDLEAGLVHVTRRADAWNTIGPVKTERSLRAVAIGPLATLALRRWRLVCPRRRIKGYLDLVFPTRLGTVQGHGNIYNRVWRPLCEAAGLVDGATPAGLPKPRYTIHSLRHARASLGIADGVDPQQLAAELGHARASFTLDRYAKLFADRDRDTGAAARIEWRLLGK